MKRRTRGKIHIYNLYYYLHYYINKYMFSLVHCPLPILRLSLPTLKSKFEGKHLMLVFCGDLYLWTQKVFKIVDNSLLFLPFCSTFLLHSGQNFRPLISVCWVLAAYGGKETGTNNLGPVGGCRTAREWLTFFSLKSQLPPGQVVKRQGVPTHPSIPPQGFKAACSVLPSAIYPKSLNPNGY